MLGESDENVLIRECLKGDKRAQKRLFDCYSGKMMTLCRRYSSDDSEAEDMLIEGFTRVFRYLEQYNQKGSLSAWIRRIMINAILRYKDKYKKIYFQELADHVYLDRDLSVDIIQDSINEEEILNLIMQMPEGYKMVFNLFAIEGYTHKEISEKLEINEVTSRSQYFKARKWLMDKLMVNV